MTKTGDNAKLEAYLSHRNDLLAMARAIVGNAHEAEDLVQESWLRWYRKNYCTQQARPILLRIVRNLAIDTHRRRRKEFEALETQRIFQETQHDAERIITARDQLDRVVIALQNLPPRTLLAFRYSRLEGLRLKEIGRRLGVSESRVSQLISDAVILILAEIEG